MSVLRWDVAESLGVRPQSKEKTARREKMKRTQWVVFRTD